MAESHSVPREIGRTGLRYTGQNIVDDELAKCLKWPLSIETYKKMTSDPIIAGSLFLIKQYIRKVEWDIEAYNGLEASDEDKRKADIIRKNLFEQMKRSWDEVITDILSFIQYGFSFHEPTYQVIQGNILFKDFPIRAQDTITEIEMDNKGYLKKIQQTVANAISVSSTLPKTQIDIPAKRLLHFRTDSYKNNPLGRSVLKNAYKPYFFKNQLEEVEAVGIERELNGLPEFRIPSEYFNANPEEEPERYQTLQEFIKIGQNIRQNEQSCLFLPSDRDDTGNPLFDFELKASKGTRAIDVSKVVERYDNRIAQSMITDFMLMGAGSTGSFALSDNKIGSFVASLEAFLEVIAAEFNRKAIPRLYELNGWDTEATCTLTHRPIGAATLTELGNFLSSSKNFITPDSTLENALRAKADLPDRDESNLYISVPTATHQAHSQRLGMTKDIESTTEETQQEVIEQDTQVDPEEVMKGLMGEHYG